MRCIAVAKTAFLLGAVHLQRTWMSVAKGAVHLQRRVRSERKWGAIAKVG